MKNKTFAPTDLSPTWPSSSPWLVLRLDWAYVESRVWMIAPEDAKAAWRSMPPILRPASPQALAQAMLLNFVELCASPGSPLEGFHAFGFSGAFSGSSADIALVEICRGKLAPLDFTAADAGELLDACVLESFPHAANFGALHKNEDGSGPRLLSYWSSKIEQARAMVDASKMAESIVPVAKSKPRSL